MKRTTLKTTVAASATALLIAAGSASAMVSHQDAYRQVNDAISGSGTVNITIRDGVATVAGNVDDAVDENAVLQAASNIEGVDRVIDLVSQSN